MPARASTSCPPEVGQVSKCIGKSTTYYEKKVCGRAARFFLLQHTKAGRMYQMAIKSTKRPQNVPSGRKIDQLAIHKIHQQLTFQEP
jgi:hypothetical protein